MKSKGASSLGGSVLRGIVATLFVILVVACLGGILMEQGVIPRTWGGVVGAIGLGVVMIISPRCLFERVHKKWMASIAWAVGMLLLLFLGKILFWPRESIKVVPPLLGILTGGVIGMMIGKPKLKYRLKKR